MKWFALLLVGLVTLLVCIPSAPAAEVVNSEGYVFSEGYFVKNGVTYTRVDNWLWVAPCYMCGRYQAGYWEFKGYTYTPVSLPVASDPEWRTKLLGIAAARDKAEGRLRQFAQDQNHFLEAVNALGLSGNFRYEAYGRNPVYPTAHGNLQLSHAGVNGNTIYGYSYSKVADAYGQTDLNQLYQQSSRLTLNAQTLAGTANSEFAGLVQQAGGNAARIAEIFAKGEAGRKVIDGINSPGSRVETKINGTAVSPNVVGPPTEDQAQGLSFLRLSGPATCVACHSGNKLEGGFDIAKLPGMSATDIVNKVLPRLVSSDDKLRMPRGLPALTGEQIRQFLGGN